MECKFCRHMLEEGSSVCPNCGKDNAEEIPEAAAPEAVTEEAAVTEEPVSESVAEENIPEIRKGITLTPGKLALIIGAVVVLTAVVVALILQGTGLLSGQSVIPETTVSPEATVLETEETVQATIPTDGNPDDETCKGSYSVSDEEAVAAMDTVVATMGDVQLTNADLQIYYWLQVQQFMGSYGSYAAYFGLDYTQSLDTQVCMLADNGITWQQYFLGAALETWQNYQALANVSLAEGYVLNEQTRASLDGLADALVTEGGLQGFDSAESYLAFVVGPGCRVEDYLGYMETYYQGYEYFSSEYEKLIPTEDEIAAYFAEHEAAYAEQEITKDTVCVDARHILVFPEGGTTDESGNTTYSDEEWEACRLEAQAILDQWLAGDATEDSFAALANEKSEDPGSNTNGGLYEDIYVGDMVEPFENWCFDPARQYADHGLVQTTYGYHVMFYVGSETVWQSYAQEDLIAERANELVQNAMDKYPMTVDYSAIKLGEVDITAWFG